MSTRTFAILALVLASCAPQAPEGFLKPGAVMRSIADFRQSGLDGQWIEVAGFPRARCTPGSVDFSQDGTRTSAASCFLPMPSGAVTPSGLGRFTVGGQEYWVLWVDADYRTLVLGTPSGAFGAVLNRGGPIPPDRMRAAERVLDFNGYRVEALVRRGG